mmetsp:Transcript_21340/g.34116  ORF Transcript_21340/g.34116 Transcript_21340/m.34116 type:complete len:257 (-) Transcript_21340:46-816(-)
MPVQERLLRKNKSAKLAKAYISRSFPTYAGRQPLQQQQQRQQQQQPQQQPQQKKRSPAHSPLQGGCCDDLVSVTVHLQAAPSCRQPAPDCHGANEALKRGVPNITSLLSAHRSSRNVSVKRQHQWMLSWRDLYSAQRRRKHFVEGIKALPPGSIGPFRCWWRHRLLSVLSQQLLWRNLTSPIQAASWTGHDLHQVTTVPKIAPSTGLRYLPDDVLDVPEAMSGGEAQQSFLRLRVLECYLPHVIVHLGLEHHGRDV